MIERLLLKNHVSFKEVDLSFQPGLIAFTGPSGAGKSVLMHAFLALFGFVESDATLIEAVVDGALDLDEIGVVAEEPNVIKYMKNKSARYFINGQTVSRKNIQKACEGYIRYLSVREADEFSNEKLLQLLDARVAQDNEEHLSHLDAYQEAFIAFEEVKKALENIRQEEKKIEELKEFASYELRKIEEVDPKIGEDVEMMVFKKTLSKKEKLEEALMRAGGIFEFEGAVNEVLHLEDIDSSFFDEAMNELRAHLETATDRLGEVEGVDVEALLDRIEKVSALKNRYGSIDEILLYRDRKKEELSRYENIAFEKKELEERFSELGHLVNKQASIISKAREEALKSLESMINDYLEKLYMEAVKLVRKDGVLDFMGRDRLSVELGRVDLKKVSSGEFNRIRLAFIATFNDIYANDGGVLILDEVDANLSGKESMSVANVLKTLSKKYQIFAISHQPQLSSKADKHYVVYKEAGESKVKVLGEEERVRELARMVSGEEIRPEAVEFATTLLAQN